MEVGPVLTLLVSADPPVGYGGGVILWPQTKPFPLLGTGQEIAFLCQGFGKLIKSP